MSVCQGEDRTHDLPINSRTPSPLGHSALLSPVLCTLKILRPWWSGMGLKLIWEFGAKLRRIAPICDKTYRPTPSNFWNNKHSSYCSLREISQSVSFL